MASPRARSSARTDSMPFLSMVRSAALDKRRRTQRFSLSTQNRRYCRLGRKRRLVLLLAWETLFPTMGFLPVTTHTRAMMLLQKLRVNRSGQHDGSTREPRFISQLASARQVRHGLKDGLTP